MIRRRDFSEAHISHLPILSGTRVNVESLVCTFLFFFLSIEPRNPIFLHSACMLKVARLTLFTCR